MKLLSSISISLILWVPTVLAQIELNLESMSSINDSLSLIAAGLMDYYNGDTYGGTPGMMVAPYYWWEAGAAWNSILDYWYYTGDTQYNDILKTALLFQTGPDNNYMPPNQSTTEGNDDQGFWGITVMAAAERNFSNPSDNEPGWLYLAQAVFNTMAWRWDTANCGGGLRWQIYTWNSGYDYKNSVANGCLFQLGARLARYTGNTSYVEWAEKVWDWMESVGFMTNASNIYDGATINSAGECTNPSTNEWTYNYGLYTAGCAYLYNFTNDTTWLTRAENLLSSGSSLFFDNGVMYEQACQPKNTCDTDQRCFKAIYSRFLGLTALMAPTLSSQIMTLLASSASAAAGTCNGGSDGHTCGLNWLQTGWDDVWGLGEQMSALEVIQANLVNTKPAPLTNSTGGTSKGSGDAGSNSASTNLLTNTLTVTTKDKAGAGIVTVLCVALMVGTGYWMFR
jgi:mannan endo-1,6-alpha-mannosidase